MSSFRGLRITGVNSTSQQINYPFGGFCFDSFQDNGPLGLIRSERITEWWTSDYGVVAQPSGVSWSGRIQNITFDSKLTLTASDPLFRGLPSLSSAGLCEAGNKGSIGLQRQMSVMAVMSCTVIATIRGAFGKDQFQQGGLWGIISNGTARFSDNVGYKTTTQTFVPISDVMYVWHMTLDLDNPKGLTCYVDNNPPGKNAISYDTTGRIDYNSPGTLVIGGASGTAFKILEAAMYNCCLTNDDVATNVANLQAKYGFKNS